MNRPSFIEQPLREQITVLSRRARNYGGARRRSPLTYRKAYDVLLSVSKKSISALLTV